MPEKVKVWFDPEICPTGIWRATAMARSKPTSLKIRRGWIISGSRCAAIMTLTASSITGRAVVRTSSG